jgi:hypothetical protein
MSGRKTSGYGSFRLRNGLSKRTRTEHRSRFGPAIKVMPPAGETGRCFCSGQTRQLKRSLLLLVGPCPRAAVAGLLGGILQHQASPGGRQRKQSPRLTCFDSQSEHGTRHAGEITNLMDHPGSVFFLYFLALLEVTHLGRKFRHALSQAHGGFAAWADFGSRRSFRPPPLRRPN